MDPIEMLKQHHAQLAELSAKFQQYVQITVGNFKEVAKTIAALNAEVAGLRAALQQQGGVVPATGAAPPAVDDVVGVHPVLGTPVTKAMLEADPKLRLRMAFSESDA